MAVARSCATTAFCVLLAALLGCGARAEPVVDTGDAARPCGFGEQRGADGQCRCGRDPPCSQDRICCPYAMAEEAAWHCERRTEVRAVVNDAGVSFCRR